MNNKFITVQEYLDQGFVLTPGQNIYVGVKASDDMNLIGYYARTSLNPEHIVISDFVEGWSVFKTDSYVQKPIHTMFVTVEEFLANECVLRDGRPLYSKNTSRAIGWFRKDLQEDVPEGLITVCRTDKSYQTGTDIALVQIEVKPIYK